MVKKVKEDEMEVLWLVEVAGMARVVYLHHRVIGQVAELLQRLLGQFVVQLPI